MNFIDCDLISFNSHLLIENLYLHKQMLPKRKQSAHFSIWLKNVDRAKYENKISGFRTKKICTGFDKNRQIEAKTGKNLESTKVNHF